MKKTLGCLRRADEDWTMIDNGDRIALGLSGGKDSLLLLHALQLYKLFSKKDFTVKAITLDMGFDGFDSETLRRFCTENGIEFEIRESGFGKLIFEDRKEKNPCALCSKLRRGALSDMAKKLGCNKLALAHNREDVLETLVMNLLFNGKLEVYSPKAYLDRSDITVIRPFVYLPERDIENTVKKLGLPVVKSLCPADGKTSRQEIKKLFEALNGKYPGCKEKMLHALINKKPDGLWERRINNPSN